MADIAPPPPALTWEQKIDAAAEKAAELLAPFNQAAATAVAAGAAVEPIIGNLVRMFVDLFKHHAKQTVSGQ